MRRAPFAVLLLLAAACTARRDAEVAVAPVGPVAPVRAVGPVGLDAPVDVSKINEPFRHVADVGEWVAKFERESREIYTRRVEIAEAAGVQSGMRVADLGAGTGLFEPLFSTLAGPGGRVFALDISPEFVEFVRRRAFLDSLTNVEVRQCPEDGTGLADGSVDIVFVCDVYHHFEHPERNLASIRASLVPGGRFVVVDFEKIAGQSSDFVMKHVRAGKDVVFREITAAGFVLDHEIELKGGEHGSEKLLKENWIAVFRKPAGR